MQSPSSTEPAQDILDELIGVQIHFLTATPTFTLMTNGCDSWQMGEPAYRGKETVITRPIIEGTLNRIGQSWLELLDDTEAQVRRWGKVCFARGPFPDDLDRLEPGSMPWIEAKEDAFHRAAQIEDPVQRTKVRDAAVLRFGVPEPTSQTLGFFGPR